MSITITEAVMIKRLRHKLQHEGKLLKRARRGSRADFGEWYLIDNCSLEPLMTHVDPQQLARERDCIARYERLAS